MEPEIIGRSPNLNKVRDLIEHVADTGLNTVVSGETGVGKELIAQALYFKSPRQGKPFVKVNCAALPDGLLESELFDFERGAFTGAERKTRGKFEIAHSGVLFLDEIGDMSLPLQSKLLHVLQSGEFIPLGSEKMVRTDTWIIAATNHDLKRDIETMSFREDLYYRLNIIKIQISPLRDRPEDIPDLIDYYYERYSDTLKKNKISYPSNEVLDLLKSYSWPGNVRELQNVMKKAIVLGGWDEVLPELYDTRYRNGHSVSRTPPTSTQPAGIRPETPPHIPIDFENLDNFSLKKLRKQAVDQVERDVISRVLSHTRWNRSKATKILKISYKTLLYKINDLNIRPSNPEDPKNFS